jgi:hypothetical protein
LGKQQERYIVANVATCVQCYTCRNEYGNADQGNWLAAPVNIEAEALAAHSPERTLGPTQSSWRLTTGISRSGRPPKLADAPVIRVNRGSTGEKSRSER